MNQNSSSEVTRESVALTNCLEPLLKALAWQGERRHLMDALPFYVCSLKLGDFLHTMQTLHYQYKKFQINLSYLDEQFMPCLFISQDNEVLIILKKMGENFIIFDGKSNQQNILQKASMFGEVYFFSYVCEQDDIRHTAKFNWFSSVLKKFNPLFYQLLFIGLILNIFALSVPIFSMVIYNQVITSGSSMLLVSFTIGVIIAIIGTIVFQNLQSKIYLHIATRVNTMIGNTIVERLLFLSPSYTEGASTSAQLSRIKDFDNIKEFFTGSLINLFFELPFVFIFIGTIALIGGSLAYIPIFVCAVFILLYFIIRPYVVYDALRDGRKMNERQELTLETLQHLRILKYTGAISTWSNRYRELSAASAMISFKSSLINSVINTLADFVMMLSAVAIIGFGTIKVIDGSISVGALIATMMLMWRVLSPIKMIFSSQVRLTQIRSSIRQVNALMSMAAERESHVHFNMDKSFEGNIRFNRVSVRYPSSLDFALMNVSLQVKRGEIVTVLGRNGSGKSTLFKLILALYKPQAGAIYIDNKDIRQMDPIEMRSSIGYVPEKPYVFYGTIASNLYLVKPTATEEDLKSAIQFSGLTDDITALPDGLETRLDDKSYIQLPASFLQRLSLASTYLKNPAIILMDEPTNMLDKKGEKALLEMLRYFRGKSTIIIISSYPDILKMSDQIILMHEGQILLAGPADQTISRLPKEFIQ